MFEGLHIAVSGIRAAQFGLDTAANNIANASTPGYTRQRVDLKTLPPWKTIPGEVGMGVNVGAISRLREFFLDARARSTGAAAEYSTSRADLFIQTEQALGEPDAGVQNALIAVYDAFDELTLEPSSLALRESALGALDTLARRMRNATEGWDTLAAAARTDVDATLVEVNQTLSRIDSLNADIARSGGSANAAMDERDLLIDQLANLVGATSEAQTDGTVHILLDGERLVQTPTVPTVRTLSYDPVAGVRVASPDTGVTAGGRVGGIHSFLTTDLPGHQSRLDQLALDIRDAVNTTNGLGSAPDPGGASWTDGGPPLLVASGAADIAVAAGVDGTDVATAEYGSRALHDATNVLRFAALRVSDPPGLGSPPLDERLRDLVTNLGNATAEAAARAGTSGSLHVGATAARQSGHGVNLDEEMLAIVSHQRALEAASRAMTAIDEALDTLINRTGLVGR